MEQTTLIETITAQNKPIAKSLNGYLETPEIVSVIKDEHQNEFALVRFVPVDKLEFGLIVLMELTTGKYFAVSAEQFWMFMKNSAIKIEPQTGFIEPNEEITIWD
ncbi:MAG: hypothetical protein LBT37_06045 [Lactobacillaceae bacterium]|jgi:hypothetical protein|nr:hypothetical protein [Lactobacillaceae bacterium]